MSRPISRPLRLLAAAALLVPLAACSSAADSGTQSDAGKPTAKAAGFPYTVTNCGVKTTYEEPRSAP